MHALEFSSKLSGKWIYLLLLLGLLVSSAVGIIGRMETGIPAQWDRLFLDTFLKKSATGKAPQNVVVVDIDELSLAAAGQWPWPRYRMATLVQAIADDKPAAIGLDILFSEPDRTSLDNIQKTFKRDFGLDLSIGGAPDGLKDNDGYLGRVLSDVGVVGARYYYFDYANRTEISAKPTFNITGRTDLLALNDAPGVLDNTYEISSQLKFGGFINNQPDSDGVLRRLPLLIRHQGVIYPHLSLATYMRSVGVDHASIGEDRYGPLIRVGDHSIPIDSRGFALLRFVGTPDLYPSISALDILNGSFNEADIKGKVVFIGSTAAALHDQHNTIFDSRFPGLKVEAVALDDIESDSFVREPTWGGTAILLACIATGLLMSTLFVLLRGPLQLFLGTAALSGIVVLISLYLFNFDGIFLSPGGPVLVAGILFTLFIGMRFAIEKRHAYVWFRQLANARQVAMESMAAVAESRDPETGAHIKRTQHYVKAIAEQLKSAGEYSDTLTREYIDLLFASAPLHDIGKVGVPDKILLKPGKLTDSEFELMKKHAEYGKKIIYSTAKKIEGNNFLQIAGEIAYGHHEKWDGTGYPLGLAGQDIPLASRIMAVADVYDAMISRRCYKPPFPHEESIQYMREKRGKIFDPAVFDAFLGIEDQIREIAATYQDEGELILGDR